MLALHESDTGQLVHTLFTPTHTGVKRRANASLSEEISGSCNLYYLICFSVFALPALCLSICCGSYQDSQFQDSHYVEPLVEPCCTELQTHILTSFTALCVCVCVYHCLEQQISVRDQRRSLKSLFQRTTGLHVGNESMRLSSFLFLS